MSPIVELVCGCFNLSSSLYRIFPVLHFQRPPPLKRYWRAVVKLLSHRWRIPKSQTRLYVTAEENGLFLLKIYSTGLHSVIKTVHNLKKTKYEIV